MTLREARQKVFPKQKDFACAIGVQNTTVSMWESGKSKPDILMANKIAQYLNIPVEEVVAFFSKKNKSER